MTIEEDLVKLFDKMAEDPCFDNLCYENRVKIKHIIDEKCFECDKVVAELQQKLDECQAQNKRLRTTVRYEYRAVDDRDKTIDELNGRNTRLIALKDTLYYRSEEQQTTIDELKDKNIEDLKELYSLDLKEINNLQQMLRNSDMAVNRLLESGKETDNKVSELRGKNVELTRIALNHVTEKAHLRDIIVEQKQHIDRVYEQHHDLQDSVYVKNKLINALEDKNIEDRKEISRLKYTISARDLTIKSLTSICQSSGRERNKFDEVIAGLEAELSARKHDSEVLMEVVDVIRNDSIPNFQVPCMICGIVDDYLDAPEPPMEEENGITVKATSGTDTIVKVGWLELP